jgi:Flp pilus assembly pilin Flp
MTWLHRRMWCAEHGQGIPEYAVVLSLVLAVVIALIRLIESQSDQVFSQIGSKIQ